MSQQIEERKLTSSPTLEAVEKQFESWRKTRQPRSPIPEDLWQAAISLSKDYSTYEISKALHLSYTKLKQRTLTSRAMGLAQSPLPSGFVELDFGKSEHPLEYVIEMEEKTGAKMRVQIKGGGGFDLLGLAQAFWRRTS